MLVVSNVTKRMEEILESDENQKFFSKSNKSYICGVVEKDLELSHEVAGEIFYTTRVILKRLSGVDDYVPVIISSKLLEGIDITKGKEIEIAGQFRSCNKKDKNGITHLLLNLFAMAIRVLDEKEEFTYGNIIYLDGYLCKNPKYRTTPLGREITEILVAVNRETWKSDYIPCITWGRTAQWVSEMKIGDRVKLYGRIQSRKYSKRNSDNEKEEKIAYEISVVKIKKETAEI